MYDSPSRARRSAKLPLSVENREWTWRSQRCCGIPSSCRSETGCRSPFSACGHHTATERQPKFHVSGVDYRFACRSRARAGQRHPSLGSAATACTSRRPGRARSRASCGRTSRRSRVPAWDSSKRTEKGFTEPVALSSTQPADLPLPRSAFRRGFDLVALRARCEQQPKVRCPGGQGDDARVRRTLRDSSLQHGAASC